VLPIVLAAPLMLLNTPACAAVEDSSELPSVSGAARASASARGAILNFDVCLIVVSFVFHQSALARSQAGRQLTVFWFDLMRRLLGCARSC
jgi:hypothetical protein